MGGLRVAGDAFQEEVSHLRSAGDVKYPFGVLRELAVSVGGKPHEIHRSQDGVENLLLGGLENIFAHTSILAVGAGIVFDTFAVKLQAPVHQRFGSTHSHEFFGQFFGRDDLPVVWASFASLVSSTQGLGCESNLETIGIRFVDEDTDATFLVVLSVYHNNGFL